MKKIRRTQPLARHEFLKWYHVASLGQALQSRESNYLKTHLNLTYQQKTLQIGRLGSESRFIEPDFIGNFVLADNKGPRSFPTFVQASAGAIPIATESIDTVILPHVLEFVADRHQVLREVERVLKPEGKLFIFGLNPWCPSRLVNLARKTSFWGAHLIPAHQLMDWLSLLKFDAELEPTLNQRSVGSPPIESSVWHELKSSLSLGYAIHAVKRNYTLIPLEPEWSKLTQLVTGRLIETPQLNAERFPEP